ncbi:MAG TPA: glycosyltransferase family 39 protein [Anaerolineae bacterium]
MDQQPVVALSELNTRNRRLTLLTGALLLVIAILIGREVYQRLILTAPPLNFDEAAHSLEGYYIMRDVVRFDVRAFWGDTHIQTLWPPGFSYLQAPVLFALGRTDDAARLFSYIALALAMLLSIPVIWAIRPEDAPCAVLVSGLIALSAPGWLSLGGLALQEAPVALVAFIVFWCFLKALRTQRMRWYVVTGFAWFFLFLTKFNYAAFALASIMLVDAGEHVRRALRQGGPNDRPAFRQFMGRLTTPREIGAFIALYLPIVLGLVFWFYGGTDIVPTSTKWRDFQFFVTNENSGFPFWSAQNLLFYVRAAADWLMPHPVLAVLALALAAWAVARIRHQGVTLLALFFVIGFALATVHPLKSDRYVAPVFPSLWVLSGLGAANLLAVVMPKLRIADPLSSSFSRRPSFIGALALVLAAFAIAAASWLTWFPRLQPVWSGSVADELRAASNQIVAWQQPERPVLIVGTFGELSPPLFEWRLRPQAAFANGNIQYDAPPGDGSEIERVQHWLQANPGTQVTLIQLDKNSALYNTADMQNKNDWRQTLVEQFGQVNGYRLVRSVSYPGAGLVVSYYLPE